MSSYSGLQVVHDDGSQQRHNEAPIPVDQHFHDAPIPVLRNSYEKVPQFGVESGDVTSGKPILGMRRRVFWLVLAIMVVVIVAAVGGGVGGSLANKKTASSGQPVTQSSGSAIPSTAPQTSATSSATTSASTPISTSPGYTGCPEVNGTLFTTSSGAKFMQFCNYEIISSTDLDFNHIPTQNLDDCINLCDATNTRNKDTGCKAVTYDYVASFYLLCWLKNGTGTLELDTSVNTVGNYSVSAVLQ
ncbi:hypothetical protein N431DRAFT_448707 [Stipitochalara longipes BDJ]|nr:hypothetical protein N431DRAFT_448707 [Stipitochalara longipes BDJ]